MQKTILYKKIGRLIRARRLELGLSQEMLGRRTRLSQAFISNIEYGQENLSLHQLFALADILGLDGLELLPSGL